MARRGQYGFVAHPVPKAQHPNSMHDRTLGRIVVDAESEQMWREEPAPRRLTSVQVGLV